MTGNRKRRLAFALSAAALCAAARPARASFTNGQSADLVLGQPDFVSNTANNSSANGSSMNTPEGVFIVTNSVTNSSFTFVADTLNNRVLIFKSSNPATGAVADFVVGQADLFHSNPNFSGTVSAYTLNNPYCVFSDGKRLFVCDSGNHRILIWNNIPSTNTVSADVEIGQPDFTGSAAGAAANAFNWPRGLWIDAAGKLYIADTRNNRVLIFNTVPAVNNASADNVLGQTVLSGCPWEGQHSNCAYYGNNNRNAATRDSLFEPTGIFIDTVAARTYVADMNDNRVLVYFTTAPTGMRNADLVLGQPDFSHNDCNTNGASGSTMCTPLMVWSDGVHLIVTDENNHRILIWNSPPTANAQTADVVVGQTNMTSVGCNDTGNSMTELCSPMSARYDPVSNQMFVGDWSNQRVQVWNGMPTTNGQAANYTLGGGANPSATSVNRPRSVAFGKDFSGVNYLYVADTYNYRVLIFTLPITASVQPATMALGQANLTSAVVPPAVNATSFYPTEILYSSGTLYVNDGPEYRILVFTSSITAYQQAANYVMGQPNFTTAGCNSSGVNAQGLCDWWDWPALGIWASTSAVVLADTQNDRVTYFSSITANGQAAGQVLGQPDMVHNQAGKQFIYNGALYHPNGVTSDANYLYVADTGNDRIAVYSLPIPSLAAIQASEVPALASFVLGQSTFSYPYGTLPNGASPCNAAGINASGLCRVHGVFVPKPPNAWALYASDNNNDRVLVWTTPIVSTDQAANLVYGQPNFGVNNCNQSGGPAAGTLCWVHGQIWADNYSVFVADGGRRAGGVNNNRVLQYQPVPTASDPNAAAALGQQNLTSGNSTPGASPFSLSTNRRGRGMATDGRRLAASDGNNNRVLLWNSPPSANDQSADVVLGQPNMSDNNCNQGGLFAGSLCYPTHVWWDGLQFFVSDTFNHRVLVWNGWPTTNSQPPSFVIGQPNFTSNGCNANGLASGLCRPMGLYSDGKTLWVADQSNDRVVSFALPITGNGPTATLVLGQPGFTTNGYNQGGESASSMGRVQGLFYDGERLWVPDYRNDRVLQWNQTPTANGQAADLVLGQPNFTASSCGTIAANTMCGPSDVFSDGQRLYSVDWWWHRVLIFNSPPSAMQQSADGMLGSSGQLNVGNGCGPDNKSICYPRGIAMEGPHLWLQNTWANRDLRWTSNQTSLFYVNVTSALLPGSITQPPTGGPTEAFKLVVNAPNLGVNWTRLRVYNNGPLPDQSLQVQLYSDNVGDGVFRPATDPKISGLVTLSNGRGNMFFSQSLTTSYATYFISVQVNPSYLPFNTAFPQGSIRLYHNFNSFGFSNTAVEMAAGVPVGVAYNSGFFNPVDFPDFVQLTATSAITGQPDVLNTTTGYLMATLTLGTTNDFAFFNTLEVSAVGSDGGNGVAGITLYQDTVGDGVWRPFTDLNLLASSATFGSGQAFISPVSPVMLSTNVQTFFLVADFNGSGNNTTFGVYFDTSLVFLGGVDKMSSVSTTPFTTPLIMLRPAISSVTSVVPMTTWWDSTFTFYGNFGQQDVSYFRDLMDNSPTHASWSNTEPKWTSGVSTFTPAAAGQNWYLHVRAYNAANAGGTSQDLGPFWFDAAPPTGQAYSRYSSSGGWIAENVWDLLTAGVTAQLTVRDVNSGLASSGTVLPSGALGSLWMFDEGQGATAYDVHGTTNILSFVGSPAWVPGVNGTALNFNGSSYLVTSSSPTGLAFGNSPRSCSAWVYPTSYASSYNGIVSYGALGTSLSGYECMLSGSGYLPAGRPMISFSGGPLTVFGNTALPLNQWSHVAITWDGTWVKFYVNGVFDSSTTLGGAPNTLNNANLFIGQDYVAGGASRFIGSLDEVMLHNRVLTDAEIYALAHPGLTLNAFVTTTAGSTWTVVGSTIPSIPYESLTGPYGTTASQLFSAFGFNVIQSTNNTTCNGTGIACGATNQIRFTLSDQAGNVTTLGPYAVLADSTTPFAISTPTTPGNATWMNQQPNFFWKGPPNAIVAGLGANPYYLLQVSKSDPAFGAANIVVSISTPALTGATGTADGAYVSTYTLAESATYYWRVSTFNSQLKTQSAWSPVNSFATDFTPPTASSFQRFSSTGGWIAEGVFDALAGGVTAQVTVQDANSGLGPVRGAASRVGWWTFNEGAGASSVDMSGNGNTAFLNGAAWTAGYEGSGVSGPFVDVSTPTGVSWAAGFTIMGWIKPTCNACGFQTIWSSPQFRFDYFSNSGMFYLQPGITLGGGCAPTTGANWLVNAWHHVAWEMDPAGTNTNRIYVDGLLAASCAGAGGPIASRYRFGQDGVSGIGASDPWNGVMDDVKVFNSALSAAQIQTELASNAPPAVTYSTTSGNSWKVVTTTQPGAGPYLIYPVQAGDQTPEPLRIANLSLPQSTNPITCGGSAPCGASDQVQFFAPDLAGNLKSFGPFSILIDTTSVLAVSTPSYPANGAWVDVSPSFRWAAPSPALVAGMGPGASFVLQVSSNDPNFVPANVVISVSTPAVAGNAFGAYVSTFALTQGATYFWRVAAVTSLLGRQGPWSSTSSFMTDYAQPGLSGYQRISALGAPLAEGVWDPLIAGVTVQATAQDTLSGLQEAAELGGQAALLHFDEGAGGTALDASGNAFNATLVNGPAWVPGWTGTAINLSGTSYANFPTPIPLGAGSWTIEAWFQTPLAPTGAWNALACGSLACTGSTGELVLVRRSDMQLGNENGVGAFLGSGFLMSSLANGWHHLAAVGSGSATQFYIDGVFAGSTAFKYTGSIATLAFSGGTEPWGVIDELRVYSTPLSPAQIASDAAGEPFVEFSTTAGQSWNLVFSTVPAGGNGPYIGLTGAQGTTGAQTLSAYDLPLAMSSNTTTCGGAAPCGASDQVIFYGMDQAGNIGPLGPEAVLVDTLVNGVYATLTFPPNGGYTGRPKPTFSWLRPSTTTAPGLSEYLLQVSSMSNFSALSIFMSTPVFSGQFAGGYLSTTTLLTGTTYYWRVSVVSFGGVIGSWTPAFTFQTDFIAPSSSTYRTFNSTGGALSEFQFNDLSSGVTAQITVQDAGTGINVAGAPAADTIGLWQFEENVGNVTYNSANGGNPGTFNGGANWGPGLFGHGLSLNGTNGFVSVADAPNLRQNAFSTNFTAGVWVNPSSPLGADTVFVHKGNGNSAWLLGYVSGQLSFYAGNGSALSCGTNAACAATTIPAGSWSYVVGTYDGTTLSLYLNGSLLTSIIYTGGIGLAADPLYIGCYQGTSDFFGGTIDDVRLYSHPRAPAQILADSEGATPPLAMWSNNAGATWSIIGATFPVVGGGAYLSLAGVTGTTSTEPFQLDGINIVQSTSSFTGGRATNEVKFLMTDVAGNEMIAGPYGVLYDSQSLTALSTPTYPVNGAYVNNPEPAFLWLTPALQSVVQYELQASVDPTFGSLNLDITTPAVTGNLIATYTATVGLTEGATFYWRVQAKTNLNRVGPWSQVYTFVTDYTPPSTSAFATLSSTGGLLGESQFNTLAAGVTAQITVSDLVSGLGLSTGAAPGDFASYWRFDEGAGGSSADAGPNANNVSFTGGAGWAAGQFGDAASLTGGNYLVTGATPAGLPLGNSPRSCAAWVYPTAYANSWHMLLGYGTGSASAGSWCGITGTSQSPAGRLAMGFFNNDVFTGPSIPLNQWSHVATTYDGNAVRFYLNGQYVSSSTLPSGAPNTGNTLPLNLGSVPWDGTPGERFLGRIDELKLFARALSQQEVVALTRVPAFFVSYSTNAGALWTMITSTAASAAAHVTLGWTDGSNAPGALSAVGLNLVQSTNTVLCGGTASACGATNQIKFGVSDRAGNAAFTSPYAVLVDTTAFVALSTPVYPVNGAYVNVAQPNFLWNAPSTRTLSGINPFLLQASQSAAFSPLPIYVSTPNIGATAAAWSDTFTLVEASTYYWRVQSLDNLANLSPYSSVSQFILDLTSPSASGFLTLNSTGGAVIESLPTDMTAGATAQITVQDLNSGLSVGSGGFGVVYTTNAGGNWLDVASTATTLSSVQTVNQDRILSLAAFGGNLYAGTGSSAQIWQSGDGVSWSEVFFAAGENHIYTLAAFNGKLYAGTSPNGKIFSSANGTIWSQVFAMPAAGDVRALAVYDGKLYAGTSNGATIYATTDGAAWSPALSGTGQNIAESLAVYNGRLYAGTNPNGRVYDTNDGTNWNWVQPDAVQSDIRSFAVYNGRLIAGGGSLGRVFSTTDGVSWNMTTTGEASVNSLTPFAGKLYAGTGNNGKIFVSTDGVSWVPSLTGTGEQWINALLPFNGLLYAGTYPNGKLVQLTPIKTLLSGSDATTAPQTLSAEGLNFSQSSNLQICGGVEPCVATNQIIWTASDLAGNAKTAGPFTIIVDTVAAHATPIPGVASGYAAGVLRPEFTWGEQAAISLGSIADYEFDLSNSTDFVTGLMGSSITASRFGNFLFNLTDGGTYYWRVRAFSVAGATSAFTSTQLLVVDTDVPVATSFITYDSVGNSIPEPTQLNLNAGVTAQITVQDGSTGIQRDGPAPLAPIGGTVLLWHLDEGAGINVNDASLNANKGTVTNPTWDNGRYGKALRFSGLASNTASVPNNPTLGVVAVTVEAWINTTSPSAAWILDQDGGLGTSYSLYMQANGNPTAWFGASSVTCGSAVVNDGRWHMLAATDDGVRDTLYVDGVQCAQAAASALSATASPFTLAERANASGPYFYGVIDEVRVLNYGAAAAQIASDYSAGNPFLVRTSTNAGSTWNQITSVTPGAAPYITFSGAQFDKGAQTLQLHQFSLAASTNGTVCGGAAPCGATNQIVFVVGDRAGNLKTYGPFAVLVDTAMGQPAAIGPANSVWVSSAQPVFTWTEPSVVGLHEVWVATDPAFATVTFTSITPNNSLYPAPSLASGTTYFWQVRGIDPIGLASPFSPQNSFAVDLAAPSPGAFASISSTGGVMAESQFTDIALGATVQLNVQDALSGMPTPTSGLTSGAGVQGLWHLDAGWGGIARDDSGNGNNGTLVGGTGWTAGRYGSALSFAGAQTVDVPYNASLNTPGAMTIEAWVKTSAANAAGDGQAVVSRWSGASGFMLSTSRVGTGGAAAFYPGVGGSWLVGTRQINDGQWHHVAATFDGALARLFIDGAFDGSLGMTNGLANTSTDLTMGGSPNDLAAVDFVGAIDDVRLLGYAQTPAQVQADYNGGPAFYVQLSTNAGNHFQTITATAPSGGNPYVLVTGAAGSTAPQLLEALGLNLAASTSPAICGGVSPCRATNQIQFVFDDQAGNQIVVGPYGILLDTQLSQPIAGSPVNATFISTNTPLITWSEKAVQPVHYVQLSTGPAFATLTWSTATTLSQAQPPALAAMTTYYWRVQAQDAVGLLSPYSSINSFVIDLAPPTPSSFLVFNSTGGALVESQFDNLSAGVSAQAKYIDAQSGLAVSTGALPFSGDGHDGPTATGGYGVMYTTSAGQTWIDFSSANVVLSATGETYIISFAQFNGSLYAGTNPSGKVYSSANGATWGLSLSGTGESEILSLAVFNGKLYAGTSPNAKIYATADGASWSQVYAVPGETDIRALKVYNGLLYAGTGPNAKIYSSPDGLTWTQRLSGTGESFIQSLGVLNGRLFAGTSPNAKIYSTVNGAAWNPVLSGTGESTMQSMAVFNGRLYAGTGPNAKVFSTPDGAAWSQNLSGSGESTIQSLASFGGKLYAGTFPDAKILATPDGTHWGQVLYGTGESYIYSLAPFNGKLYAGTIFSAEIIQLAPNAAVLGGSDGTVGSQVLAASGLNLSQSTSAAVCGGAWGCSATDQIVFSGSDRAGNAASFGPYAVLVTTSAAAPVINSLTAQTSYSINVVIFPVNSDLAGIKSYQYFLSTSGIFAAPVTTSPIQGTTTYTFTGLTQVTTYYVRAQATDNLLDVSPFSVAVATQTNGVMFFSTSDISSANVLQGLQSPMMRFTMYTAPGPQAIFSQLTVAVTGGPDSDLTDVELWNDVGETGVWNPATDIELGAAPVSGGQAVISLGGNTQNIGTTPQNFFIVFKISPTGTIGDGLSAQLPNANAVSFSNPYRVPGLFPMTTNPSVIQDGPNNLIITPSSLAPGIAAPGANDVVMMRLRMQTNFGTSHMAHVVLNLTGTAASNEISAIKIYRDNNNNGTFDPGVDGLVTGGNDTFLAGVSTVVFTAQTSSVTVGPTIQDYFVAYNIAGSAVSGHTFGVEVASGTMITMTDGDTSYLTIAPATSTLTQIVQPNNLSVSMMSTIPGAVYQGGEYSILKATFSVDVAFAQVAGVTANRIGSSVDGDVSRVSIFLDGSPPSNGGYFNPGVDILLGTAAFSAGVANVAFAPLTLNSGTTYVMFVVYDINPLANPGDTVGTSLTNAAYIDVVSTATTLFGNFPARSSTQTINAVINTMMIPTAQDVTTGGLLQGATNQPMLRLDVRTNQNAVSWTGLNITRTGTGSDNEISAVKVWTAGPTTGSTAFNVNVDTLVSAGNDVFSGGVATINFPQSQVIGVSSITYYITLSVQPTANPGDTIGVSLTTTTAFTLNSPNVVSSWTAPFPLTAGPVVINQFPNTITVSTSSIAPLQAAPGATDIGLLKLTLNTNVSFATWRGLKIDRIGGSDADVAVVKVYYDINQIGSFNSSSPGQYLLLTSTTNNTFGSQGTAGTINVAFATVTVLSPSPQTYYVAIDLSTAATPTDTLAARVLNQTYFTVTAPNSVAPTGAQSTNLTVATPPSLMNFVAASSAPAGALQGATNVVMETIHVRMQQFTGQWTGLTVLRSGTASDTDIQRVKLYYDTSGTGVLQPLLDTLVGTGTFTTGQAQLNFGVAQTITTSTRTYFLAYDVSPVANSGVTMGATIGGPGSVQIVAPNGVANAGFPDQSGLTLISPTQSGVYTTLQDKAPAALMEGSTNQLMASLTMDTTIYSVVWNTLQVQRTGTSSDSDITAIHVWADVDGNGVIDAGDYEVTSGNDKFVAGNAFINLGVPQTISQTPQYYLISLDVNMFACTTCTVGVQITSPTWFGVPPPNFIVNSGYPFSTSQPPIVKRPDYLVTSWTNMVSTGGINQGVEAPMGSVRVNAQRDYVNWVQMRLQKQGSLSDGFVNQVRVYNDVDGTGQFNLSNVLVGTGTFAGGIATINFNTVQRVTTTQQVYVVTFVFDPAATVGASIGFSVPNNTYDLTQSPDFVSSANLPFSSVIASILDARTPTTPVVTTQGPYWAQFDNVPFVWASTVALGSITNVSYAIGTSPGSTNVQNYTSIPGLTTSVDASALTLQNDTTYYISVRAQSSYGFLSPVGISPPILLDMTVPTAPNVTLTQGQNSVLVAWQPSLGGPSGILGYLVQDRRGDSPQWINAKTNQPIATTSLSVQAAALTAADLGQNGSMSFAPTSYTTWIQVSAVSGAGVVGPPSPEQKVLFGPTPKDTVSDVSSYPNPFDSRKQTATITYTLNSNNDVTIKIFSIYGNLIKTMSFAGGGNGGIQGSNSVPWDGADDSGAKTSKGIYLAVVQSGGTSVTWKIGVIH